MEENTKFSPETDETPQERSGQSVEELAAQQRQTLLADMKERSRVQVGREKSLHDQAALIQESVRAAAAAGGFSCAQPPGLSPVFWRAARRKGSGDGGRRDMKLG